MKLKEIIRRQIKEAVRNYDFEEFIENAIDQINLEAIIEKRVEIMLENTDIEDVLVEVINDTFEEEFDEYEIAEIIKERLEN